MKAKGVPVTAAKEIAEKYDKDQVLIFCYDEATGTVWRTTYGRTKKHCQLAAAGAERLEKILFGEKK